MPAWELACRLRACAPWWPTVEQPQPIWGRSAAMVRRTLGQYVAVCSRLQLTSHTQEISTLSRIKCESYIFIKKCIRTFIEVVIMFDYVPHIFVYIYICMRLHNSCRYIAEHISVIACCCQWTVSNLWIHIVTLQAWAEATQYLHSTPSPAL